VIIERFDFSELLFCFFDELFKFEYLKKSTTTTKFPQNQCCKSHSRFFKLQVSPCFPRSKLDEFYAFLCKIPGFKNLGRRVLGISWVISTSNMKFQGLFPGEKGLKKP